MIETIKTISSLVGAVYFHDEVAGNDFYKVKYY